MDEQGLREPELSLKSELFDAILFRKICKDFRDFDQTQSDFLTVFESEKSAILRLVPSYLDSHDEKTRAAARAVMLRSTALFQDQDTASDIAPIINSIIINAGNPQAFMDFHTRRAVLEEAVRLNSLAGDLKNRANFHSQLIDCHPLGIKKIYMHMDAIVMHKEARQLMAADSHCDILIKILAENVRSSAERDVRLTSVKENKYEINLTIAQGQFANRDASGALRHLQISSASSSEATRTACLKLGADMAYTRGEYGEAARLNACAAIQSRFAPEATRRQDWNTKCSEVMRKELGAESYGLAVAAADSGEADLTRWSKGGDLILLAPEMQRTVDEFSQNLDLDLELGTD